MLTRKFGYLLSVDEGPPESTQLEQLGYAVLTNVFGDDEVATLGGELEKLFDAPPTSRNPDRPLADYEPYRFASLNASAAAQQAVGHRRILDVLEPVLGEDCHVIANTSWRNPALDTHDGRGGGWHIDAGPHVPRPPGVPWDNRIPYPIFAVGAHILVQDCDLASGPTGVLSGSHRSGRTPPFDRVGDNSLTYEEQSAVPLVGSAGDVVLFVSDVWHRRLPTMPGDRGRFFLQAHYGRRDIAQRLLPTSHVNHLTQEAVDRATTPRAQRLIGLHPNHFYDG